MTTDLSSRSDVASLAPLGSARGWVASFIFWALIQPVFGMEPPAPLRAVTRSPQGKPVCGLGKEFHAGRRAAMMERLGEGVLVMRGLGATRGYTKFYQDKNFWYLTGISSPNVALVLDGRSGRHLLFLPGRNATKEQWDGELWDVEDAWAGDLSGFSEILPTSSLESTLQELLADKPKVFVARRPWIGLSGGTDMALPHLREQQQDPFDGRPSREAKFEETLVDRFQVEIADASSLLAELRLIKQPVEIEAMRRAAEVGAEAIAEAMRSTGAERGEWELEALMSYVHERNGALGPAYAAICASGPNNNVLHYFHSNRRMKAGELLLVDYGPDLDYYTTDITRTWPVSGKFSERQLEVYRIVQEAQAAAIEAAKPGNRLSDVVQAVSQVFAQHGVSGMSKHLPCHFIGLEVHDVSTRNPFEPGMAIAIEPGLYSDEEGFGIRIEDVVVITAEGNEILSRAVPVEPQAIEALMAETGLLD